MLPTTKRRGSVRTGELACARIGSTVAGKYRIDSKLGAGGMGAVYRATRLLIGDEVAIKILHSEQNEPRAAERFRREAQAANSAPGHCEPETEKRHG